MSDLDQARWQPWIDQACAALEVGSAGVDVAAIHDLTSTIARDFVRPMAPVAAYLWGLAAEGQAGVENVLDIMHGGIDSALRGLGKGSIHDLGPDDILVPEGFTRRLGG